MNLDLLQMDQRTIEDTYDARKLRPMLDEYIEKMYEGHDGIKKTYDLIAAHCSKEHSYEAKTKRLEKLSLVDLEEAVIKVLYVTLLLRRSITLANLVGQTQNCIPLDNYPDKSKTMAEVITMMTQAGLLKLTPARMTRSGMIEVTPVHSAPKEVHDFSDRTCYLPPMISKPKKLRSNNDTPYLTTPKESLILKSRFNHHGEDICLDALNLFNSIPLALNTEFLCSLDAEPTDKVKSDPKKLKQFQDMQRKSYEIYKLLVKNGNKFYLPHKPDKRGRTYCQGYHCSYQGTAFHKAMIEFAEEEVITGF